jgi:hypothetical protein
LARGCHTPNPVIDQSSNLFKPRSSRPAAKGADQIPVSVEDLDRRAISEAVGVGKMDRGGDYSRTREGAVLVSAEGGIPERVIMTAWFALPGAILVRVALESACVGSHRAVSVKRHYGWERRSRLVGIITVDSHSGYLPHAFDCRTALRSIRAPQ